MPFAAGLNVNGDGVTQAVEKFYGDDFTMKIISGSLPPGLQLGLPSSEWTVTGTPAKTGTYPLTVQFAPQPGHRPEQRPVRDPAAHHHHRNRHRRPDRPDQGHPVTQLGEQTLQIQGFGATHTVTATSSGKQIGTFTESSAWEDGYIRTTSGSRPARESSR